MPLLAGPTLALIGILLVALNLHIAVTAISPIAVQISSDIPLDNLGLSVIGTLRPIAFALAGIFGASIARKLGLEPFLIIAAVAMVIGHLMRALAGDYPVLFLGSVLALTGMGVGSVLLPPVVKKYFPDGSGSSPPTPGAGDLAFSHRLGRRDRLLGDLVQRVFDVRVDAGHQAHAGPGRSATRRVRRGEPGRRRRSAGPRTIAPTGPRAPS